MSRGTQGFLFVSQVLLLRIFSSPGFQSVYFRYFSSSLNVGTLLLILQPPQWGHPSRLMASTNPAHGGDERGEGGKENSDRGKQHCRLEDRNKNRVNKKK